MDPDISVGKRCDPHEKKGFSPAARTPSNCVQSWAGYLPVGLAVPGVAVPGVAVPGVAGRATVDLGVVEPGAVALGLVVLVGVGVGFLS